MKNQEKPTNRASTASRQGKFPSPRQSNSYFPIRGWHSLISHIITLVRGTLRTLAGYARGIHRGGGDDSGGGAVAGFSSAGLPPGGQIYGYLGYCAATTVATMRLLLCPNGPAPPRVRAERETTPSDATCSFVRSRAVSRGRPARAARNSELVIITL